MTTTTRAPFRKVDILALRLDPVQTCSVVEDQQDSDTHVKVLRSGQAAPELIRNEDVMPLGSRPTGGIADLVIAVGSATIVLLVFSIALLVVYIGLLA